LNDDAEKTEFHSVGLSMTLYRFAVLSNRAFAWCSLGLYHRARDDLQKVCKSEFVRADKQLSEQLNAQLKVVQERMSKSPITAVARR